jgi:hypothetical protein
VSRGRRGALPRLETEPDRDQAARATRPAHCS